MRNAITQSADPLMTRKLILIFLYPVQERLLINFKTDLAPAAMLTGVPLISLGYLECIDTFLGANRAN
jgi:hypothetical protein